MKRPAQTGMVETGVWGVYPAASISPIVARADRESRLTCTEARLLARFLMEVVNHLVFLLIKSALHRLFALGIPSISYLIMM